MIIDTDSEIVIYKDKTYKGHATLIDLVNKTVTNDNNEVFFLSEVILYNVMST